MRRMTQVALLLSITMMCASPNEVLGQNRRTGNSSRTEQQSTTTKSQQSSNSGESQYSRSSGSGKSKSSTVKEQSRSNSKQEKKSSNTSKPSGNNSSQVKVYDNSRSNERNQNNRSNTKPNNQNRNGNNTGKQNHNGYNSGSQNKNGYNSGSQNRNVYNSGSQNRNGNKTDNSPRPVDRTKPGNERYSHRTEPAPVSKPHTIPEARPANWERPYLDRYEPAPVYRDAPHRYGYRIHDLPAGCSMIHHHGCDYYYCRGIYYKSYPFGGYIVCRPPVGIHIANTLFNVALSVATINAVNNAAARIERAVETANCYSRYNTSYQVAGRNVYVNNVSSQIDEQYYYQDGVFYTVYNGNSYVIEAPIGALVNTIPEDYEIVEMNGGTYYLVENTLYQVTVIDGVPYFEVICNL